MSDNRINKKDFRLSQLAKIVLLSTGIISLSGCFGVDSDNEAIENSVDNTEVPAPDLPVQDVPVVEGLSALHTDGVKWVNAEDETVILKGTNLGNWLLHEYWMMNQSSNTVATDQCTLEATLDERFGFDERERLLDLFRDNWIAERDWDILEEFGLNAIRLPFVWNVIEDENNPMTLRDDAWQYIDETIAQAEARGMYVILDLHGAVGAQGENDHSGCAGKNEYWSTPEYQARTTWLWEQIAARYKNNGTVAGYGLLNEPWGTDANNLADVMLDLHDAVREVDANKIIILPGHHQGIDSYGHPDSFGGTNVAFEMHFYPGIFGWGEPTYETHRDWLTCGKSGTEGVCAWATKMKGLSSPLLVGEFQPWANTGYEFGGENTRATYDKFAEFNWAATNWSYKVLTGGGGQGAGTWGMVTNKKAGLGLVSKASTWDCAGWDSTLDDACGASTPVIESVAEGMKTYYLVVKFGSIADGNLDVSLDNLSLLDDMGNDLIVNGNFGSASDWTTWAASTAPTIDFNTTDASKFPTGAEGGVLRMSGVDINGGIYQAITLEGGKKYAFSGVFKDNESVDAWAEIYIVADAPLEGADIVAGDSIPAVDFAIDPIEDIEALFELFGTVEYEVHQPLLDAMTATEPSTLFTLPAKPTDLSLSVDAGVVRLTWAANLEADVTGYNVYRSVNNNTDYQLLAENINAVTYLDSTITETAAYYYKVAAVDAQDSSYASDEVVTGTYIAAIPGIIQAENFTDMSGFEVEVTLDTGSGNNMGFSDAGDWLEYTVNISTAGDYVVEYRLATKIGSDGFTLSLGGNIVDTVVVAATGGWQTWATQSSTVTLPAGEYTLRLDAVGGSWNLNWLAFSAAP
ncbi:MAG: endoglucanase [Alteromonadaceae bacterium]|jgi:endoglucanase